MTEIKITTDRAIERLEFIRKSDLHPADKIGFAAIKMSITALCEMAERKNPLTLEELRERDGEYVRYVRYTPAKFKKPDQRYQNVKLDTYDESAYSDDMLTRLWFDDYGKTWLAYGHDPGEG